MKNKILLLLILISFSCCDCILVGCATKFETENGSFEIAITAEKNFEMAGYLLKREPPNRDFKTLDGQSIGVTNDVEGVEGWGKYDVLLSTSDLLELQTLIKTAQKSFAYTDKQGDKIVIVVKRK